MIRHTLSIIICTKDREESLRNTIATILPQSRLPEEIIIVDDGALPANDLIAWVTSQAVACRYFKKDKPSLVASRNLGASHAQGEILLYLDDDVLLEPTYLAALMALFDQDAAGLVGGATGALQFTYSPGVLRFLRFFLLDGTVPGAVLPSGCGVLVRQGEIKEPMMVQWLAGCNMAFRRAIFADLRFDQRLSEYGYAWADDLDFSYRVGQRWRLLATPDARLTHLRDPASRIHARRMGFLETNYRYRFFVLNMPQRLRNWLALGWALVGTMARNLWLLLLPSRGGRRAAWERLLGNLQGLRAIYTGKDFRQ